MKHPIKITIATTSNSNTATEGMQCDECKADLLFRCEHAMITIRSGDYRKARIVHVGCVPTTTSRLSLEAIKVGGVK